MSDKFIMHFFTFQDFTNVFKKRYKMFITIFILLMLLSLYANKTFLNDKLTHKYTVVFDYKFFYSWTSMSKKKIIYDDLNRKYRLPIADYKALHANYFELIYNFNIEDLKDKNSNNPTYNIAKSFHFDTPNFTYPNRRLTLRWDNLNEAEKYLQNLHQRAMDELVSIFEIFYNIRFKKSLENIKEQLLTFSPELTALTLMNKFNLDNKEEVELFTNDFVSNFKEKKQIDDSYLMRLLLSNSLDRKLYAQHLNFHLEDSSLLIFYYYLGNKYYSSSSFLSADLNLFPDLKDFNSNINNYLPKFKSITLETNSSYIYFIEILLALLLSFFVIFTFYIKDKKN
jgi:hypothetical protein